MELDASLLEYVACPQCRAPLAIDWERHELACTQGSCGLAYPVRDGIPVLRVDEARRP